jgi:hypothetical protein
MFGAVIVVLLFALGMVACGGGDDSDSPTTEATGQQQAGNASGGADSQPGDGANKGGSADGNVSSGDGDAQSGGDASNSVPKQHDDSGGGSAQFKEKGGDNSIQEFGEEVEGAEFDAAAAALHTFLDARAEGDWAVACEYIAKSIVEQFERLGAQLKQSDNAGCPGVLGKLTNPGAAQGLKEEAAKANVHSLRVEDEQAIVIYTGIDGTALAMPMANEDSRWKVNSLAGVPLG